MEPKSRPMNPSQWLRANCLSRFFLWWVTHILKLGYQRPLQETDVYDVLPEDSSVKLSNNLGREWEKELYRWRTGRTSSLFKAIAKCYWNWVAGIGLLYLLLEIIRVTQAMLICLIVEYFEADSDTSRQEVYIFSGCWGLCYMLVAVLDNVGSHKTAYCGMKIRVACTSLVYRKILRLSRLALQDASLNQIGSLMSTDAHRFDQSLEINYIWISPIQAVAVIVLLWRQLDLGPVCLIGVVMVCILATCQYCVAAFISKLRSQQGRRIEHRIHMMNEILTGIVTIKTNCWEKAYSSLVHSIRGSECLYLRVIRHCQGLNSALHFATGKLLIFATFSTYLLLGGEFKPSSLFGALVLFELLKRCLGMLLPWGLHSFLETLAAVKKIERFLLLEERNAMAECSKVTLTKSPSLRDDEVIKLDDYSASWTKDTQTFILEGLNFSVLQNQMVAVIGAEQSGKSSLLASIAGDLLRQSGSVQTKGHIILTSQHSWIFPGTIRDNIVFGAEWDRNWYNRVLYACCMIKDLEGFPQGDHSLLREKGAVSLTNGQRARIGLARAIYHKADIYLIDNILDIMEKDVAEHIVSRCFSNLLRSKTVVIVTEDNDLLKTMDLIIVLNQGQQVKVGQYKEIHQLQPSVPLTNNINNSIPNMDEHREDDVEMTTSRSNIGGADFDANQDRPSNLGSSQKLNSRFGSSLEALGSQESLDQTLLEYESTTDSDLSSSNDNRERRAVHWSSYVQYFRAGGGVWTLMVFMVLALVSQVLFILCDWWLYQWSKRQSEDTPALNNTSSDFNDWSQLDVHNPETPDSHFYIYLGLLLGYIVLTFLASALFNIVAISASEVLHNEMFVSVLWAQMSFFEKNAIGQILSRFGHDVTAVDDSLPVSIMECVQFSLLVLGAFIIVIISNYWISVLVIPLILLFAYIRHVFLHSARALKKLEQSARVPIYQHLSNTLEGLPTLRAFSADDRFLRHFDTHQDRHMATTYLNLAVNRWFAIWLDGLAMIVVTALPFLCIAVEEFGNVSSGLLGLAMAYCVTLMPLFQHSVTQVAEVNSQMASVERIMKSTLTLSEPDPVTDVRPPSNWPQYGIVTLEGATVVQLQTGVKVIRNMMACFRAYEKIGVLSDSDASKKALMSAILRLSPAQGIIRLDGLDISGLGVHDLREKIGLVPQDPVLFGCSIRRNLDPFTRYPDATLWRALELVQLKEKLESIPGDIYADMTDYGHSFSLGERQLVYLARALVRNCRVVLFEESPSVVMRRTEHIIQEALSTKFSRSTVIVFAHRLRTVIELDRVMVLSDGRVREIDTPDALLQSTNGFLVQQLIKLPDHEQTHLRHLARDKQDSKPYVPPPQTVEGGKGVPQSGANGAKHFLPSFQTNRLSSVLSHFGSGKFSTNKF